MEEGVLGDMGHGVVQQQWGTKITWGGLKLENRKAVKTYRCKSCGYLESYAK